jgi:hypothetical protein
VLAILVQSAVVRSHRDIVAAASLHLQMPMYLLKRLVEQFPVASEYEGLRLNSSRHYVSPKISAALWLAQAQLQEHH